MIFKIIYNHSITTSLILTRRFLKRRHSVRRVVMAAQYDYPIYRSRCRGSICRLPRQNSRLTLDQHRFSPEEIRVKANRAVYPDHHQQAQRGRGVRNVLTPDREDRSWWQNPPSKMPALKPGTYKFVGNFTRRPPKVASCLGDCVRSHRRTEE